MERPEKSFFELLDFDITKNILWFERKIIHFDFFIAKRKRRQWVKGKSAT